MSVTYYDIPGAEPLAELQELQLPRAVALADAIQRDRDMHLVGLARIAAVGVGNVECLMIDVDCDGVPTRNPFGLHYRERLALLVSPNDGELPTVLALRQDFPALVHQNRGLPSSP